MIPLKPGYYWAQWRIPAEDTHEGDQLCPSMDWEIVQVTANDLGWEDDPEEDEALIVSVAGVRESQWRDCFVWGNFVAPLNPEMTGGHAANAAANPAGRPAMTGDELQREIAAFIHAYPLKDGGLLILAAARAMLDKQTSYSPSGSRLLRLETHDGSLTVALAKGDIAAMLSTAYDALKEHLGCGGAS